MIRRCGGGVVLLGIGPTRGQPRHIRGTRGTRGILLQNRDVKILQQYSDVLLIV